MTGTIAPESRWVRQQALAGFGNAAQQRLAGATVVVVGAGGLGSALLPVLVSAGIGAVHIIDDDLVEASNLHRQTLHAGTDIDRAKVDSALESLRPLGPDCTLTGSRLRITAGNAAAAIAAADLVIDATDDLDARYALDDAAAAARIPLVWGSAVGYAGQVGVAWSSSGPRWRDLFPVRPPDDGLQTCELSGVLPSLCTTIGGLMATEALKLLTGVGTPLIGRVLVVDALTATVREIPFTAADPPVPDDKEHDMTDARNDEVQVREVADLLEDGAFDDGTVQFVDVREPWEAEIATIPGSILIPLGTVGDRMGELDKDKPVVVYCHAGRRSASAVAELRAAGFDARSMVGGIATWSSVVDPSVPQY